MITNGGGITCTLGSNPIIENNFIIENSSENGGGIYCNYFSSPKLHFNSIVGNYANLGGGIYCANLSNALIYNTVFAGNYADTGGGIYCIEYSDLNIINTLIWSNTAPSYPAIFLDILSLPIVSYNDVQGGWEGVGNIDIDPLFRDPANGDFHLMAIACGDSVDSPCIDAGDPNILDSFLDCNWGLGEARSDMGAYGGGDSTLVGIEEIPDQLPNSILLSQNYPNPFNTQTAIRYSLPKASNVNIEIYDILGRKVETILNSDQQAGDHRILWNADDYKSGLYFFKIQTDNFATTKKMILLK